MFIVRNTTKLLILALVTLPQTSTIATNTMFVGTKLIPTTSQTLLSAWNIALILSLVWALPKSLTYKPLYTLWSLINVIIPVGMMALLLVKLTGVEPIHRTFNQGLRNPLASLHPVCLLYWSALLLTTATNKFRKPGFQGVIAKTSNSHHSPLYAKLTLLVLIWALGLSMWWANQELFWGYFWNWDPIEMSLLTTFLVHNGVAHQTWFKRSAIKGTNTPTLILITVTYFYVNNKSGSISSVHSFSNTTLAKLSTAGSFLILAPLFTASTWRIGKQIWTTRKNFLVPKTHQSALLLSLMLLFCFVYNELNPNLLFKYTWFQPYLLFSLHLGLTIILVSPHQTITNLHYFYKIKNHKAISLAALIIVSMKIALLTEPKTKLPSCENFYQLKIAMQTSQTFSLRSMNGLYTITTQNHGFRSLKNNINFGYCESRTLSAVLTKKKLNHLMFITPHCKIPTLAATLVYAYGLRIKNRIN